MDAHLTEEEIALFIEEQYDEIDRKRIYDHLRGCKQCFTEYLDATRFRGTWISDGEPLESSRDLVDAGTRLVLKNTNHGQVHESRPAPSRKASRRKWSIALAGVLAVLLFSVAWLTKMDRGESIQDLSSIVGPIRTAADWASTHSSIVIPGSEFSFDANSPAYRTNPALEDESISSSLLTLVDLYENHPDSRDVLFWLCKGFLATGRLTVAETYLKEARRLYPDDREISLLSALAEYFKGNTETSEQLLRGVLSQEPGNAVALMNLAVILIDRNEISEAHTICNKIQTLHPNTPIAERSRLMLQK